MIGHQREVLSALGIDLWIPRVEPCQNRTAQSLWRDQAQQEMIEPLEMVESVQVEVIPLRRETEITRQQKVVAVPPPLVEHSVDNIQQIDAFQLQTLQLPHVLLVVDVTHLSADQQQLWLNIQRAMDGQFTELQWPFAWAHVQDGRGAKSYIAGLIEAQSLERHVIYLGAVPHYQHTKAMQLASLQEMIEQPLLKRRLWQMMRNTPAT